MMEFTKIAQTKTYPANATIISQNAHVEHFFMIHRGDVEVVLLDRKNSETVISHLSPGDFFGEIELMRGGRSTANVRASSEGPVEVLAVTREDFKRVMDESPITAEEIAKIVEERLKAHRAADHRKFRPFSIFRRP